MIKSTDLRVGNFLLKIKTEEIFKIDGFVIFMIDEHNARQEPTHYEGILLNEEWLERLGFKDPAGNKLGYRIPVNESDELCWYRMSNEFKFQTQGSGFTRKFDVSYVHQVQNLYFALTGHELI